MARLLTLLAVVTAAVSGCGGGVDYGPPRVCASSAAVVDGRLAREDERFATVKIGACSGTLVAPSVVITAAHCHNSASFVTAGDLGVSVWDRIVHPDYVGGWQNDIEILILEHELPGPYATIGAPRVGSAVVSGYGVDENGNGDELRIGETYIDTVTQTMALTDGSGSDSCYGDSGGPIYQNGRLVAVTSHGRFSSSSCGAGSVNVTPDAFADWIDTVTGGAVVFSDTEKCN